MFRNIGLDKDRRSFGVDAGGEINASEVECFLSQHFRVLRQCYGVEVNDAIKALILVLKRDPIFESAEVVSDMKLPRGLGTTENAFFHWLERKDVYQTI